MRKIIKEELEKKKIEVMEKLLDSFLKGKIVDVLYDKGRYGYTVKKHKRMEIAYCEYRPDKSIPVLLHLRDVDDFKDDDIIYSSYIDKIITTYLGINGHSTAWAKTNY